jgi:hypothetical protein
MCQHHSGTGQTGVLKGSVSYSRLTTYHIASTVFAGANQLTTT